MTRHHTIPFLRAVLQLISTRGSIPTVATLCIQFSRLNKLQKIGTYTYQSCPNDSIAHSLSMVLFCSSGRSGNARQIFLIGGLLIDDLHVGSIFHVISWYSNKAHRPVRSICTAETIAAGEGINVGKTIPQIYSLLLCLQVDLVIVADSKDLYTTLTTRRKSVDRSIRGDMVLFDSSLKCKM